MYNSNSGFACDVRCCFPSNGGIRKKPFAGGRIFGEWFFPAISIKPDCGSDDKYLGGRLEAS
jgi:hypothetical protein